MQYRNLLHEWAWYFHEPKTSENAAWVAFLPVFGSCIFFYFLIYMNLDHVIILAPARADVRRCAAALRSNTVTL